MQPAILENRFVIRIAGEDAARFLNGLVTTDVGDVAPNTARFAALLTPQGKILFDFLVVACPPEEGGGFVLDAPRALADELVQRLNFYRLRAKVTIEPRPDLAVVVVLDGTPDAELGLPYADPRDRRLGERIILPAAEIETAFAGHERVGPEVWEARRIALGVPEGGKDFIYGDTFPHEADMDQLGGIDFTKGCYVGQEVVSRVEHRGGARKRVLPVGYQDAAPSPGIEVAAGGQNIGFMGSAQGGRGLAMLRLDRVEQAIAAGQAIEAGGVALTPIRPDWATFPFPGERAPAR